MKGLLSLVRRTTPSSFTYICERNGNSLTDKVMFDTKILTCIATVINIDDQHLVLFVSFFIYVQMDELACFAPGMIALGSLGYGPGESQKFLSLAEEVS